MFGFWVAPQNMSWLHQSQENSTAEESEPGKGNKLIPIIKHLSAAFSTLQRLIRIFVFKPRAYSSAVTTFHLSPSSPCPTESLGCLAQGQQLQFMAPLDPGLIKMIRQGGLYVHCSHYVIFVPWLLSNGSTEHYRVDSRAQPGTKSCGKRPRTDVFIYHLGPADLLLLHLLQRQFRANPITHTAYVNTLHAQMNM